MPASRPKRQIFDVKGHAFFVTFSCYHRVPLLNQDRCKRIILGQLDELVRNHQIGVVAFVIMPDHVHVLLRPQDVGQLSPILQQWKRLTATTISKSLNLHSPQSHFHARLRDSAGELHVWQKRSYAFNIYTPEKALEKIQYMHHNPVKANLVEDVCDWPWSTARHFLRGEPAPITLVPYDGPIHFQTPFQQNRQTRR